MTARESYNAGRLQEAIAAQTQEVKARPADQSQRLFLFELLAFAGDLDEDDITLLRSAFQHPRPRPRR